MSTPNYYELGKYDFLSPHYYKEAGNNPKWKAPDKLSWSLAPPSPTRSPKVTTPGNSFKKKPYGSYGRRESDLNYEVGPALCQIPGNKYNYHDHGRRATMCASPEHEYEDLVNSPESATSSDSCYSCSPESYLPVFQQQKRLFDACQSADFVKVKRLIKRGVDVNAQDRKENYASALHYAIRGAAETGHTAVAEYLLKVGAKPNIKDDAGQTPLHWACSLELPTIVRKLLWYGASPVERDNTQDTPLHAAMSSSGDSQLDIMLHLLQCMEIDEMDIENENGRTPLHYCCFWGACRAAKMLIRRGAKVNVFDKWKETPLHIAARKSEKVMQQERSRSTSLVEFLVEHDADVSAKDGEGLTALHRASEFGDVKIVQLLVKHRADVTAQDITRFNTPLHLSAKQGKADICKVLLESGASPYFLNMYGITPRDLAKGEAKSILSGEDFASKNKYDKTPKGETDSTSKKSCEISDKSSSQIMEATVKTPTSHKLAIMVQGDKTQVDPESTTIRDVSFKWEKGVEIGRGSFGFVYKCKKVDTAQLIALKEIYYTSTNKDALIKEVMFLKSMRHERIVEYLGSDDDMERCCLLIFMEYMPGGSIDGLVDAKGAFSESVCQKYTKHILEGLAYLHGNSIIHRDIKGANILLDFHDNAKIGDLGISKSLGLCGTVGAAKNTPGQGTPLWTAPEVLRGETYGRRCDIWSLGCTVVQMLTQYPPCHGMSMYMFCKAMSQPSFKPEYSLPQCSHHVQDFLDRCFREPTSRSQATELLDHPFIRR